MQRAAREERWESSWRGTDKGHIDIKRRKSAVLIATKGDTRRERAGGKVDRRVRVAKGREDMTAMKGCRGRCVKRMATRRC